MSIIVALYFFDTTYYSYVFFMKSRHSQNKAIYYECQVHEMTSLNPYNISPLYPKLLSADCPWKERDILKQPTCNIKLFLNLHGIILSSSLQTSLTCSLFFYSHCSFHLHVVTSLLSIRAIIQDRFI